MLADRSINPMTGEQAQALGYRRVSNAYCMVSRIDRPDWVEHLARQMRRAVADFYVRGSTHVNASWADYYRRVWSHDAITLSGAEYQKVTGSGYDACGYIPKPGDADKHGGAE